MSSIHRRDPLVPARVSSCGCGQRLRLRKNSLHQRSDPGEALVGGCAGESLFGRQRGHPVADTTVEQCAEDVRGLRGVTLGELLRIGAGCVGDLEATPQVDDVGRLGAHP